MTADEATGSIRKACRFTLKSWVRQVQNAKKGLNHRGFGNKPVNITIAYESQGGFPNMVVFPNQDG
jgi:hypothetical protein